MSNKMDFIKKVLENIPDDKKRDTDFVFKVNEKNPEAFDMLIDTSELKNDKDFALRSMQAGTELASRVYDHMSDDLKHDEDVILAALEGTPVEEKAYEAPAFPTFGDKVETEEVKAETPVFFGGVEDTPVTEEETHQTSDVILPNFGDIMDPKPVEREFPFKDDLNTSFGPVDAAPNTDAMGQIPGMGEVDMSRLNETYNQGPYDSNNMMLN